MIHYTNINSKSTIKIRTDGTEDFGNEYLFINNNINTIDCYDGHGSIGKFIVYLNSKSKKIKLSDIEQKLNNGTLSNESDLLESIEILFELFEPGKYNISISEMDVRKYHVIYENHSYYPTKDNIIFTEKRDSLNRTTIKEYKKSILSGTKPIILITSLFYSISNQFFESNNYIIDGHHKFMAYSELGIKPNVLFIERIIDGFHEVNIEYFPEEEQQVKKAFAKIGK